MLPSPAQPSPAQRSLAVPVLLALALGLSATQAQAAFEVRHYFGSSASHNPGPGGSDGGGSPPGDSEEEVGEQRVVEFTITPNPLRVGIDEQWVLLGKVADANGNYDPTADYVDFSSVNPDNLDDRFVISNPQVVDGAFQMDLTETLFGGGNFPFPAQAYVQAGVLFHAAVSDSVDPGLFAHSSIEDSRNLVIDGIATTLCGHPSAVAGVSPNPTFGIGLEGRVSISVTDNSPIAVPSDFIEVVWTSTIGTVDVRGQSVNNNVLEGRVIIRSTEPGTGTLTARIVGWGDFEHSVPIEFGGDTGGIAC